MMRFFLVLLAVCKLSSAKHSKSLECEFGAYFWNSSVEACIVNDQPITGRDFFISSSINLLTNSFEISNNEEVTFLPKNLGTVFPNLKHLSVSDCALEEIEDDIIRSLPNLVDLCLENNEIEVLRKRTFDLIPELTVLDLSGNHIEILHSNVFNSLRHLENLFLADNAIRTLNANVFNRLEKLVFLDLSFNQISALHSNLFRHLKHLNYLTIRKNNLARIPNNLFRHNPQLTWIYLGYNRIDRISMKVFEHMEKRHDEDEGKYVLIDLKENVCVNDFYDVNEDFFKLKRDLAKCSVDDDNSVYSR